MISWWVFVRWQNRPGFDVEIVPVDIKTQRSQHYDVFMLEHDYIGAFVVGFSLSDPWIQDFKNQPHTGCSFRQLYSRESFHRLCRY